MRQGAADLRLGEAGNRDQVARLGLLDLDLPKPLEGHQRRDALLLLVDAATNVDERLVGPDLAAVDPSDRDPSPVGVVVQRRHEHLERRGRVGDRCRDNVEDRLHQRAKIIRQLIRLQASTSGSTNGIQDREVELGLVDRELEEEVHDQPFDLVDTRIPLVDLVDDDDRAQANLQRAAKDGPRLRHRAFGCVDQQNAAIRHIKDALDLTAEVGVARRVDDVDLHVAVTDRGVLREDGDAALALEIIGIHDQVAGGVRVAKNVRLLQEAVHERGLAVVNVGDDGDVAQVRAARDIGSGTHMGVSSRGYDARKRHCSGPQKMIRANRLRIISCEWIHFSLKNSTPEGITATESTLRPIACCVSVL